MFLNDAGLRLKHEVDFLLVCLPPQAGEDEFLTSNNLRDFLRFRAAIRCMLLALVSSLHQSD